VIAALFVEKGGAYYGLEGVDPWPEERDARLYPGPWPVVAHPPCHLWGHFAKMNFARYGGEHNRPGNDGGCFASALASVRRWGGVLEHPADTLAWPAFGLHPPRGRGWQLCWDDGWVAEVWQSAYGHKARKRTWLYAVTPAPPTLDRRAPPGTHQIGQAFIGPNCRGDRARKPPLGKRESLATPTAFRDLLLSIAGSAIRNASCAPFNNPQHDKE
jgi:hypothetical protein